MTASADVSGARRVTAAAVLLAAGFLLSRVLGFLREAVLAYRVGVGPEVDAYSAAFQLPDILNYFLAGGALSIAFIPHYTATRARRGEVAAERLFATVLGTVGLVVLIATGLLWWFAEPLLARQFHRFGPRELELTTRLTRIVLPAQICFVCGGIVQAVLMAQGRFAAQAAAPVLYNLGIIGGGVLLAPRLGVEGFAWGALAGAVAGPLGMALLDARGRVRLGWRVAPLDRGFLIYLGAALPLMAGVTLLTVDEWYERWFGQLLGPGAIGVLRYGRQLMLVPVAVVGQTLATAALPALARLVSEGRRAELDALVLGTLRGGTALGVLAAAGVFAVAEPLVRFVYQRGAFGEQDAAVVGGVLAVFCLAVPGWIAQQIAVRSFYARGDTWRPMLLGSLLALLAIPLYLVLGPRFGVRGLAAAGVLGMSANALATLVLARRLHGAPAFAPLAATLLRAVLAAAPGVLLARAVLPLARGSGPLATLVELGVGGALFAAGAGLGVACVGDAPLRAAAGRLVGALRRRLPGPRARR